MGAFQFFHCGAIDDYSKKTMFWKACHFFEKITGDNFTPNKINVPVLKEKGSSLKLVELKPYNRKLINLYGKSLIAVAAMEYIFANLFELLNFNHIET